MDTMGEIRNKRVKTDLQAVVMFHLYDKPDHWSNKKCYVMDYKVKNSDNVVLSVQTLRGNITVIIYRCFQNIFLILGRSRGKFLSGGYKEI